MTETVDHPEHYQTPAGIEAIEVMERYGLGPHLFVAMKHLLRAGRKGDRLTDLRKAKWYVDRRGAFSVPVFVGEQLYADGWKSPADVVEAFGIKGSHARAVVCILAAAIGEGKEELLKEAAHRLGEAIKEAETP
jgi:hypothetical protein